MAGLPKTHALLSQSPALNAGDPSIAFDSSEGDQRGTPFARVAGGRIDIGAYETQEVARGNLDQDQDNDGMDFLIWQRSVGAGSEPQANKAIEAPLASLGSESSDKDHPDFAAPTQVPHGGISWREAHENLGREPRTTKNQHGLCFPQEKRRKPNAIGPLPTSLTEPLLRYSSYINGGLTRSDMASLVQRITRVSRSDNWPNFAASGEGAH